MIAGKQYQDIKYAGSYNVGPDDRDCMQTGELVDTFIRCWGDNRIKRIDKNDSGPHEANFLRLDCSKLRDTFGWSPRWDNDKAIRMVVEWTQCWCSGGNVRKCMDAQIKCFLEENKKCLIIQML